MDKLENKLRFFISSPHSCNYLKDHKACSLFADPLFPKNKTLYSSLVANGFRRSGEHLYKPCCDACSECVAVRIPVFEFGHNRNQKRTWDKNQDLTVRKLRPNFNEEHFQMYKKYLTIRHPNGGMDNPTEDNYKDFLWTSWSDTVLFEFRCKDELIAVAVVDQLKQAFSAVYTYFNPKHSNRSPGKFAVLYLIDYLKRLGFPWLYLGYWISNCDKMKYKIEYQPIECFANDGWKKLELASHNDFPAEEN